MTTNNSEITVILPVHKLVGEKELKMAKTAIKSIINQKSNAPKQLIIVHSNSISLDNLNELSKVAAKQLETVFLVKEGATDFPSMINHAVASVTTPYFSILEFDDEYTDIYFDYVNRYLEAQPGVNMLLPLVAETNLEGQLLKYSNEVPWVQDFSEIQGTLDHKGLLDFAGINLTGAIIRTTDFQEAGGLKTNLPVVFNYEFLLRLTLRDDVVILSIPKIGYLHKNGRETALFSTYMAGENQLTSKELNFWFEAAKTECAHKAERPVAYTPTQANVAVGA